MNNNLNIIDEFGNQETMELSSTYYLYLLPNNHLNLEIKMGMIYWLENGYLIYEAFGINQQPLMFLSMKDLENYFIEKGLIKLERNSIKEKMDIEEDFMVQNNKKMYYS